MGGGLGADLGACLAAAAGGAAGRTGGTLGGCGRCSIPPTGNCSSTQRRHASANFSRSPSTFHLDAENARSHGPMFSAMTRQRASPSALPAEACRGHACHGPLEVQRFAPVATQCTKVQGLQVGGADR